MSRFLEVTGPAAWASYLVNGDASGLEDGEQAKADAWLDRNQVRVIDLKRGADGAAEEARFTWSMDLHAPELDCRGGDVVDYVCEPLPTA